MWKIGNIIINNRIVLAPMAGISNIAYIKICEDMNVGFAISELISSEAIIRNNKKTFDMLNGLNDIKIPFAVQLFGSNKDTMAKSAKILVEKYNVKIIDINMGCPVPKVALRSNAGSALLKDKTKAFELVNAVVKAVNVPVTVKIRSGWDKNNINCVEIAKAIEEAGASAITIHPRTREQGYGGLADWELIKAIKSEVKIPVIGNGDIKTIYDAKKMLETTNCDAIMIGRAALGNPWFLKQCHEYIENNRIIKKPSYKDIIDMIYKNYRLLKSYSNEKIALLEVKIQALAYLKNIPNSKELRNRFAISKKETDFIDCLNLAYEYIRK